MKELTSVELNGFSQLLTNEETAIRKYRSYAQECTDPALTKLCKSLADRHTRHYETILSQMQ